MYTNRNRQGCRQSPPTKSDACDTFQQQTSVRDPFGKKNSFCWNTSGVRHWLISFWRRNILWLWSICQKKLRENFSSRSIHLFFFIGDFLSDSSATFYSSVTYPLSLPLISGLLYNYFLWRLISVISVDHRRTDTLGISHCVPWMWQSTIDDFVVLLAYYGRSLNLNDLTRYDKRDFWLVRI